MNTNLNSKIKTVLIVVAVTFVGVFLFNYFKTKSSESIKQNVNIDNLTSFTKDQLLEFDGTDPSKPIYIALNGYVYDVSAGREYYKVGGTYHYLAGRDSSNELNIIGGEIINKKYPVVGILK